jgi:antitoxin ParD1/3/4
MNITLEPEQEKFLQEKLKTGKYKTIDEVVIEAFKLLEERDSHYEKWLEETRKKVAVGIEQLERGEGIDSEIVIAKLKEQKKRRQSGSAKGLIWMSPDFDEPLPDFRDYME